jgi:hypothetical protein
MQNRLIEITDPELLEGELVLHGGGFFSRILAAIKKFFKQR